MRENSKDKDLMDSRAPNGGFVSYPRLYWVEREQALNRFQQAPQFGHPYCGEITPLRYARQQQQYWTGHWESEPVDSFLIGSFVPDRPEPPPVKLPILDD